MEQDSGERPGALLGGLTAESILRLVASTCDELEEPVIIVERDTRCVM